MKPLKDMSVDELRFMRPSNLTNPPLVSLEAFDEVVRRNNILAGALSTAIDAIKAAPDDAFGDVQPNHDGETGYFIKDELLYRLSKILSEEHK